MLNAMNGIQVFSMLSRSHAPLCSLLALALAACPDGDGGATDASADVRPGGRTYLLAARAEGYDATASRPAVPSLTPTPADLTEALVIPADLLGIPWAAFDGPDNRPSELPAAWLEAVTALETLARDSGQPIALALSPLSPEFDTLAPLASDQSGALVLNPTWKPACYDPSKDSDPLVHAGQYAGYVTWITQRFAPRFVILGQRLNLYEATCGPSAYAAVASFTALARTRLAASATVLDKPLTVVTVDVEDLYGFPKRPGRCATGTPSDCLAGRSSLLTGLDADALGLESYPFRAFSVAADIPSNWLATVADLSTLPVLIAGTALPATRLEAERGVCVPLFESDPAAQRAWLDQVLALSSTEKSPLVVWRSLVDLLPATAATCPCAADFALCAHLDGLSAKSDERRPFLLSGLADAPDGALALWRTVLAP
jgi:hypothetical protein